VNMPASDEEQRDCGGGKGCGGDDGFEEYFHRI
jgi:hypothetical protein